MKENQPKIVRIAGHDVRPVRLPDSGPLIRVGAIPNRISVARAETVMSWLRAADISFRLASVPVAGFDRHSIFNRDDYYAGEEQISRLFQALFHQQVDLVVMALAELPPILPAGLRLAAVTEAPSQSYALLRPKKRELRERDRIGVYSFSLIRQLRMERPEFHYEQKLYSFEQAIAQLEAQTWQAAVIPAADFIYSEDLEENYVIEKLPKHRVVPPAGQGALALVVLEEQHSLASQIYTKLHNYREEQAYRLESELARLLSGTKERAGSCLWWEEGRPYMSLYNPHFLHPFQRWVGGFVDDGKGKIDRQKAYHLLQGVLGTLHLLGVGPSAPQYLTEEGREILTQTERLYAYGAQVESLYHLLPGNCQISDLDLQMDLRQPEVLAEVLLENLRQGLYTTVLFSGDGYLFSGGATLARALGEKRIPFRYSPGLSTPLISAQRVGVPLLFPGLSPALHIYDARDPLLETREFGLLPGTLAFSTTPAQIPHLLQLLLTKGIPPTKDCLYLHACHSMHGEAYFSTLERLYETEIEGDSSEEGLLIVGEVIRLHEWMDLRIHKNRLLEKKTILLPLVQEVSAQQEQAIATWETEGAYILKWRLLRPVMTEACRSRLLSIFDQLRRGTLRIPSLIRPQERRSLLEREKRKPETGRTWLAFVTVEAVTHFFDEFRRGGYDLRQLSGCAFAAASDAVFRALGAQGIQSDFVAPKEGAEALALAMCGFLRPEDQTLVLRAEGGSNLMEMILTHSQLAVQAVGVYEEAPRLPSKAQWERILSKTDAIPFFSEAEVEAFAQGLALAKLGHDAIRKHPIRLLAARPQIAEAMRERGFYVAGDLQTLLR